MRDYTNEELLQRVKALNSFKNIPSSHWILGIRSKEDKPNSFDDRFYLYKGEDILFDFTGTTNPGSKYLVAPLNTKGTAVVKSDEWYYNLWKYGLHRGKMPALTQVNPVTYYRDNDKDLKSEETGGIYSGLIGINFHTATYHLEQKNFEAEVIGGWSAGCQVINNLDDYNEVIGLTKSDPFVSFCLLKEF